MIDADLADLYGVPTKALNQAVRRNLERFPSDFMFQLTIEEKQEVVTNCDHLAKLKFSSSLPNVFTEHGALILGSVAEFTGISSPDKAPDNLEITVDTDEADLNACAAGHRR